MPRKIPTPAKRKKVTGNKALEVLAEVALQEQADRLTERQDNERRRQVALRQMIQQQQLERSKTERFQKVCDHLLGNHRRGVIPDKKRTALRRDELSDGASRIYCEKCRMEWRPGDTRKDIRRMENRDGFESKLAIYPNPTGVSYKDIRQVFYTFENARERTTRAFRIIQVEPDDSETEAA